MVIVKLIFKLIKATFKKDYDKAGCKGRWDQRNSCIMNQRALLIISASNYCNFCLSCLKKHPSIHLAADNSPKSHTGAQQQAGIYQLNQQALSRIMPMLPKRMKNSCHVLSFTTHFEENNDFISQIFLKV